MKILEWLPRENASNYAIRVLLHNIVNLELAPGSEVSSAKLAEDLSLSRMTVRMALAELRSRAGLVNIIPQRGSYISKIDYDRVEEARFMRLALEIAVAKQACEGITQEYREALEANLREYRIMQDTDKNREHTMELDNEFHRLIFASVNKLWTYQKLKELMVHFDRLRQLAVSSIVEKTEDTLKDHEDILYAIVRRDAEMAEMLVTRHLTRYRVDLETLVKQYPDYFVDKKKGQRKQ